MTWKNLVLSLVFANAEILIDCGFQRLVEWSFAEFFYPNAFLNEGRVWRKCLALIGKAPSIAFILLQVGKFIWREMIVWDLANFDLRPFEF